MRVPRRLLKKKFSLKFSHSTVNNWLNKELDKPRKTKIRFLLKRRDKEARKEFCQIIINIEITGI